MKKPEQLYDAKDVKRIREKLLKDQKGIDPITGLEIPEKQAVLDHDHKTQSVRAVLHRQSNSVLGKLENMWIRYLAWWYTGTLSEFLRGCANYLERKQPEEYLHPSALKRCKIDFSKLNEASKRSVLNSLGAGEGSNATQRKKLFEGVLKSRNYTFEEIQKLIKEEMND